MKRDARDDRLLDRFMERISALPDRWVAIENVEPGELLPGMDGGQDDSIWADRVWKPWKAPDGFRPLDPAYAQFPLGFPPLYERWATRFRWLEFSVPDLAILYENRAEAPLETVLRRIAALGEFSGRLLARGMLPFGSHAGGASFDPVCFDCRRSLRDGDCPVIRVNHEAVLLYDDDRPWQTWSVAESFREFVELGIERLSRTS